MPLQDRKAQGYAVITDMRARARDKALHLSGSPAAERKTEPRPPDMAEPGQRGLDTDHGGAFYLRFERAKHHAGRRLATAAREGRGSFSVRRMLDGAAIVSIARRLYRPGSSWASVG